MVAPEQANLIKSATRVLDVLDLFARRRSPMRASEIGDELEFPRSSALGLLRTMVETGHLMFDPRCKTYFPTVRVARLGEWLVSDEESSLSGLLADVRRATGECTILAVQNRLQVQFIAFLPAAELETPALVGMKTRMIGTSCGGALMMAMSDADIVTLVRRIRRARPRAERETEVSDVLNQVRDFRKSGYASTYRVVLPGTLTVAVPIPAMETPPLALAVGGPESRILPRKAEILAIMRGFVARYCARRPDRNTRADDASALLPRVVR
jgi:DNA-binding IclR family transcriptional regulator